MNKGTVTVHDFRHICLTCLKSGKDLTSIVDSKAGDMLNYCNLCMASEADEFPNKICSICLQNLKQSYEFKQMIENSHLTLKELLSEAESNRTVALEHTTLASFNNNEDISGDLSDTTTDALIIKCDESVLINFSNENSGLNNLKNNSDHEEYLRFYKNNSNPVGHFQNCEEQQESISGDVEDNFEEDTDLISFLDKPLPPPLQYCCQKCDESFDEENDLHIHQSVHNPELICMACSKKFTNKQMLKRHLKIHLIRKPHVCKICSKNFAESYALTKHLRRHSGVPREKKHLCTECGQGFSEPYYLKVHLRKHTGERPLVCPDCHKPFADPRSLKIHSMIHTGEKPHKCNICVKSFIQRANLTKHLRTHTGEKPYLCRLCDKRFSQSSTLGKHLRTHTGEKLYSCDKCEKRYVDKAALINHIKRHNGNISCHCKPCVTEPGDIKNCSRSTNLRQHLHSHVEEKPCVCDLSFDKVSSKNCC